MKVLLLTDGIYPFVLGGMQKHSYYLSKVLPTLGIDLTLVHTSSNLNQSISEKELNDYLFNDNSYSINSIFVPSLPSKKYPGHYLLESYVYSIKVFEEIKDTLNDYDLIYIKGLAGWKTLSIKKNISTPILYNAHGYEMFQYADGIKMKLEQLLLRPVFKYQFKQSDYIVSYGGKITSILESININKNKIVEIPAGFESIKIKKHPNKKEKNTTTFLFVGRNERRKGVDEINKAIHSINQTNIANLCSFEFIGPIPKEAQINASNVYYHGELTSYKEVEKIYSTVDILLAPSLSEGMPNVIMEAMANGLAIIATDVGANKLMVNHENGILLNVPVEESLEKAISDLISTNKDSLIDLKQNSITKINSFTWEVIGQRTKALFQKLINGK